VKQVSKMPLRTFVSILPKAEKGLKGCLFKRDNIL